MMFSLLAATVLLSGQTPSYVTPYHPKGPVIEVRMQGAGSFEITTDPKTSPLTVRHILDLVQKRFYDGQRVHRVEWWVTQWGAPASRSQPLMVKGPDGKTQLNEKVGDGGSGKDIPKFEPALDLDFVRGMVGIASSGLQLPGDSQLFILKADAMRLYRSYAVVGKVTKGMEVVDKIKFGDRIRSMRVRARK